MKNLVRFIPAVKDLFYPADAKLEGYASFCHKDGIFEFNMEEMKTLDLNPFFYKRNGKLYFRIELK